MFDPSSKLHQNWDKWGNDSRVICVANRITDRQTDEQSAKSSNNFGPHTSLCWVKNVCRCVTIIPAGFTGEVTPNQEWVAGT